MCLSYTKVLSTQIRKRLKQRTFFFFLWESAFRPHKTSEPAHIVKSLSEVDSFFYPTGLVISCGRLKMGFFDVNYVMNASVVSNENSQFKMMDITMTLQCPVCNFACSYHHSCRMRCANLTTTISHFKRSKT